MHIRWVDRTIFTATSAGLGDFVVASAVTGYLTPAQSGALDGESYHYAAQLVDGNSGNITDWEVGTGSYTAGTGTLARTTIEFSSNGNAKVNFSKAPQVMLTALAQDFELELDADTNFYVATTGNNSNTGLAVGSPWLTLQFALDFISGIELNGFTATINIADGTYEGVLLKKPNTTGIIRFLGNASTPANVIINPSTLSADKACFDIQYESNLILQKFVCTGTGIGNGERGISAFSCLADVELNSVSFTNLATLIYAAFGPTITAVGAISITGNAVNVIWIEQAVFRSQSGTPPTLAFTIVGTPAWTDCFINVDDQGLFDNPGQATFTGSATGKKFRVRNGGVIQTLTNNLNYFPGNIAGDILVGGQYDIYFGTFPINYVSNGGSVLAGPYPVEPGLAAANFGPSAGETSFEFVNLSNNYRIQQTDGINQITIYLPTVTGITGLFLKIWRQQGSKYDLVSISSNLVSSIVVGLNTISISPVLPAEYGDYIGARVEYAGGASVQNFHVISGSGTLNSVINATPSITQYDWLAQTSLVSAGVVIGVYMSAPIFVCIGDSITSGYPTMESFADLGIANQQINVSYPYFLGQRLGYSNQNLGINAETSTQISARFAADVVAKNPRFCIINAGINDILSSVPNSTIIANFTSMLTAAVAANILPIVIGVTPFGGVGAGTTPQMQQRDLLNPQLQILVESYGGIYVNPDPMGIYLPGGDRNNLWALAYPALNNIVHPSPSGYSNLAELTFDVMQRSGPSISPLLAGGLNVGTGFFYNFEGQPFSWGQLSLLNTYIGFNSGNTLGTGTNNTGVGNQCLVSNTTGVSNTAIGDRALFNNTTGGSNMAIGGQALFLNEGGNSNMAIGAAALLFNVSGDNNVAVGQSSLRNSTVSDNTALGAFSLQTCTTSGENVAVGVNALNGTTTGSGQNVAVGKNAAFTNTSGAFNTSVGYQAHYLNQTGSFNVSVGRLANFVATGDYNTGLGSGAFQDLTTGTQNVAVGWNTGRGIQTGSNNTIIGANVTGLSSSLAGNIILADGSGTIRGQWDGSIWNFGSSVLSPSVTNTITTGYTVTPGNGGTLTTGQTFTATAVNGNYQYYTNNGAHTFANPSADCAIDVLVTNATNAGAITFSTFTVGSTGDALTTTNGNKFIISTRRINGTSTYLVKALQ